MLIPQPDGSLGIDTTMNEEMVYYFSNHKVLAKSDGCFNITSYSIANMSNIFQENSFHSSLKLNNVHLPVSLKKNVNMIGRSQKVSTSYNGIDLVCNTFLDIEDECIFQNYVVKSEKDGEFELDFDFSLDLKQMLSFTLKKDYNSITDEEVNSHKFNVTSINSGYILSYSKNYSFQLTSNDHINFVKKDNQTFYFNVSLSLIANVEESFYLAFDASNEYMRHDQNFQLHADICNQDISNIQSSFEELSFSNKSDFIKSFYISSLNCTQSSYKDFDGFKGFRSFNNPGKTFYRDSGYIALSLLNYDPSLVRSQIITLAGGVNPDGECPDSVPCEPMCPSKNHIVSAPGFLNMVHDYFYSTKDYFIFDEIINNRSMLDIVISVADCLMNKADENYLIYIDWENEKTVNNFWTPCKTRHGYVTYVESLFYGSMFFTGELLNDLDMDGDKYLNFSSKVRDSINKLLWSDEKGYYLNYRTKNFIEDNLSIDTIITAIFEIADEKQTQSVIKNMECLLETKNNPNQPYGDWGTMVYYPEYKKNKASTEEMIASDFPFFSCLYAYAKMVNGFDYTYPLTRWFENSLSHNISVPCLSFNPISGFIAPFQAMSGFAIFAINFGI